MLFQRFHVGLWSKSPLRDLKPLLEFLLPEDAIRRITFIFGRGYSVNFENFRCCYKVLSILYSKCLFSSVCKPHGVLLVDVYPLSLLRARNLACYIPWPLFGDLSSSHMTGVIPNVAMDLLPFIYPLHKFECVNEYMKHSRLLDRFIMRLLVLGSMAFFRKFSMSSRSSLDYCQLLADIIGLALSFGTYFWRFVFAIGYTISFGY